MQFWLTPKRFARSRIRIVFDVLFKSFEAQFLRHTLTFLLLQKAFCPVIDSLFADAKSLGGLFHAQALPISYCQNFTTKIYTVTHLNSITNLFSFSYMTLNLLQLQKKDMPRQSIKRLRKMAGWDHSVLNSILAQKFS